MKNVKASSITSSIIGTYEGEVLDPQITNKNGLDITRDVMEAVLESEDYADGIENGWFIGYLGHPEDPDCQDFKNGCIVMTEMSIESDGKVHAKFNLINTPVGQIVKAFNDAGVKFGISIRGAGDIIGNAVDPETFVFRGYDLVAFPAYPGSIPTFTEIAASTDRSVRKKYEKICAAVNNALPNITSSSTLKVIQAQFAPMSDEYKAIENRCSEITAGSTLNIDSEKLTAMTDLYLEAMSRIKVLATENEKLKKDKTVLASVYNRKLSSLQRITEHQLNDALEDRDRVTASRDGLKRRTASLEASKRKLDTTVSEQKRIIASLQREKSDLENDLNAAKKSNLIYKRKIEAATSLADEKDATIGDLRSELRETVTASTKLKNLKSNLDQEVRSYRSEVRASKDALDECQSRLDAETADRKSIEAKLDACNANLLSFQSAYAELYANMIGARADSISITPSTTVDDIKSDLSCATNTVSLGAAPVYDDEDDDYYASSVPGLITV